jgi:hypothetical protein
MPSSNARKQRRAIARQQELDSVNLVQIQRLPLGPLVKSQIKQDGKAFRKYAINRQFKGGTWIRKGISC